MKRLLKILARLYPSDWRKRYGVEYDALLEQAAPRFRDAFDILRAAVEMHVTSWDLKRIVLPCAIAGALIAAAISFAVPAQYISKTVISVTIVDGPARPKDNPTVRDSAVASLRDALSETSLAGIIQKLDLYPRERVRMSQKDVIDRMRKDIYFMPVAKGRARDAFALQFSYPNPQTAQKVDADLASAVLTSALHLSENRSPLAPARHEIFRLETDASLPLEPSSPRRGMFGAGGLLAGIAGGLLLAAFIRRHHRTVTAR